ncbi:hypothetical protein BVX94_01105 [bacterium B17]|nr:hypothetical protein BVX94_01105 [bacterium B17]
MWAKKYLIAGLVLQMLLCVGLRADTVVGERHTKTLNLSMSSGAPDQDEADFSEQQVYLTTDDWDNEVISLSSTAFFDAYQTLFLEVSVPVTVDVYGESVGGAMIYLLPDPYCDTNYNYVAENVWVFKPKIEEVPHYINACARITEYLGAGGPFESEDMERYVAGFDPIVEFSLLPRDSRFTEEGKVRLVVGEEVVADNQLMSQGYYMTNAFVSEPVPVYLSWEFGSQIVSNETEVSDSDPEFYEAVFPKEGISVPYDANTTVAFGHMCTDPLYGSTEWRFVPTTWEVPDFAGGYTEAEQQGYGSLEIKVPDTAPVGVYPVKTKCACSARDLNVVKINSVKANEVESFEGFEAELFVEYSEDEEGDSTTTIEFKVTPTPNVAWPEGYPLWRAILPDGSTDNLSDQDGKSSFTYTPEATGKYVFQVYCGNLLTVTVYVLDLDLVPDWNRDRKIDSQDEGQVTSSNPFRFWINDDDDEGDIASGDSDEPGQDTVESDSGYLSSDVDGRCDLLDFFPLWLDLNDTMTFLPYGDDLQYKLQHEGSAVRIVYTDLKRDKAGSFLTEDGNTYGASSDQNSYEADTISIHSGAVTLEEAFLDKIVQDSNKGILMLEGSRESTEPLVLEIWKNKAVVFRKEMPLSLSGVEDMYRYKNLRTDGKGGEDRDTATNLPDEVTEDYAVIFIHGYNVDSDEARGQQSEVFKRLYQSGYKGRYVSFSWFGDPDELLLNIGAAEYYESMARALEVADEVATEIYRVKDNITPNVDVIAHSAGNIVVGSAIHDHQSTFRRYIALDAAVALECYGSSDSMITNSDGSCSLSGVDEEMTTCAYFDAGNEDIQVYAWKDYDVRLHSSEWYRRFPASDPRSKLTWRNRFESVGTGDPVAYNFYSSTEEVLRNYDESGLIHGPFMDWLKMLYNVIPAPGNFDLEAGDNFKQLYAWVKQEKTKGVKESWLPVIGGSPGSWGGWGFNEDGRFVDGHPWATDRYPITPEDVLEYFVGSEAEEFMESLKTDPFFRPDPEILFDAESFSTDLLSADSTIISGLQDEVQGCTFANWLLVNAFPARTWAMGANENSNWGPGNNDNMSQDYMTDVAKWPRECLAPGGGSSRPEWHHGDFKDVAYMHVYKLYEKWVDMMEAP